jgi:hypothetical protein
MASFKSYGRAFNVADRYAAGHVINDNEAGVLNQQMAEMISHRLRNQVLVDLAKGDTVPEELAADADAFVAEAAASFDFGTAASREKLSPLEKEARTIAERHVLEAVKSAGLTVGKRGVGEKTDDAGVVTPAVPEETGEGIYAYSTFRAKVREIAKDPEVVKSATSVLEARNKKGKVSVAL